MKIMKKMKVNVRRLAEEIKARGLTLAEAAGSLQISYCSFYRKMKSMGKAFTVDEMHRLIEVLELSQQEAADIFICSESQVMRGEISLIV